MNVLPAFFQTDFVLLDELLEPEDTMDNVHYRDEEPLTLLNPDYIRQENVFEFIKNQQRGDTWKLNSLYSDKMYGLFPKSFRELLDTFDRIMGNSRERSSFEFRSPERPEYLTFSQRYCNNPDEIIRLTEMDDVRKKLHSLFDSVQVYYNYYLSCVDLDDDNVTMRSIIVDFLELIGYLVDRPIYL
jgi:hypothetical protein